MFYRPSFQRTHLQFRLDNERVPGEQALMLEDPAVSSEAPWDGPDLLPGQIEIERISRFDLTDTDAIVIGE